MPGENGQLRIKALMINTGLTDKDLDQEIVEKDLSKIADLFDSVDDLCEQFGLSKADMADVETQRILKGTKESAKQALEIWINRYSSEATFKNRLIILLESEKGVVAKDVANYVSNRPKHEPTNNQQWPEDRTERQSYYIYNRPQQEPTINQPRPDEERKERQGYKKLIKSMVLILVMMALLVLALYNKNQLPILPTTLTMTNFEQHKAYDDVWYSPPVYTHHQGYKIGLGVYANGFDTGEGKHIFVWVFFMRGEFDDSLKWPFRGVISYQLLDQVNGKDHKTYTSTYDDETPDLCCTRVTEGGRSLGRGATKFIAYTELEPKYLRDDTLLFQIHKVELK